jgi:hypothetical protein
MKNVGIFATLLIVAVVSYVAAGPLITLHEIKTGIQDQDSEKLASYIDFPALRENLKEQFSAYVMQQASTDLKGNPFAAFGMLLGAKIVDSAVDSFVTPSGLSKIAAGKNPQDSSGMPQSSGPETVEPFKNARYSYDSPSRFSAWVRLENGGDARFVLSRDGLSWKLTNIIIPIGAGGMSGNASTASATPIPLTAPSSPASPVVPPGSLKIEAIDTRATETNDVWARYAWKLTVSNSGSAAGEFNVRIEWQDADGFVIDEDEESGLAIDANDTHTFTGDKLISYPAASRVSKIEANITQ